MLTKIVNLLKIAKDEDYEVHLDDGRECFIRNDCSLEWGGIEFEDETTIQFRNIPTKLLDELVQKTPIVIKATLEQFEEDWYQQKDGRFVAIRKDYSGSQMKYRQ